MNPHDRRFLYYIFFGLCLLSTVPILAFKYIPIVDLPNHILAAAAHASKLDSVEGNLLSAHWLPSSYILFYSLMCPLIKLFGHMIATKIILSLYVVLLPCSLLWFIRYFNPGQSTLAFFSFLFIYTYHFDYGFVPYCLGIPLVFVGLTLIKKVLRGDSHVSTLLAACLVTSLIYLSHFVNFAAYVAAIPLIIWTERDLFTRSRRKSDLFYWKLAGRGILVFGPSMILIFIYFVFVLQSDHKPLEWMNMISYESPFRQLVGGVRFFFSADGWLDVLEAIALLGFVSWLIISRSAWFEKGFLIYMAILNLSLPFLTPRWRFLGSWDIGSRFSIFGAIPFLMCLKINSRRAQHIIIIFVTIMTAFNIAVRTYRHSKLSSLVDHYVQAVSTSIPSGSKIYVIHNAFPDSRIPLMLHAIAYFHLEHGGYSPYLFTNQPHVAGLKSSIELPRAFENWRPWRVEELYKVLPFYDYLVVLTYGLSLPPELENFSEGIIHRDLVCTIIELSQIDLTQKPENPGDIRDLSYSTLDR